MKKIVYLFSLLAIFGIGALANVAYGYTGTLAKVKASSDALAVKVISGIQILPSTIPHYTGIGILVTNETYADALVAGVPAYIVGIPMFYLEDNLTELVNMLRSYGITTVIIIGGPAVVPTYIEDYLMNNGFTVIRIWGVTRYDTSAQVAEYFWNKTDEAVIITRDLVNEETNVDQLNLVLAAYRVAVEMKIPILIVPDGVIPESVIDALIHLGVKYVFIYTWEKGDLGNIPNQLESLNIKYSINTPTMYFAGIYPSNISLPLYNSSIFVPSLYMVPPALQLVDAVVIAAGKDYIIVPVNVTPISSINISNILSNISIYPINITQLPTLPSGMTILPLNIVIIATPKGVMAFPTTIPANVTIIITAPLSYIINPKPLIPSNITVTIITSNCTVNETIYIPENLRNLTWKEIKIPFVAYPCININLVNETEEVNLTEIRKEIKNNVHTEILEEVRNMHTVRIESIFENNLKRMIEHTESVVSEINETCSINPTLSICTQLPEVENRLNRIYDIVTTNYNLTLDVLMNLTHEYNEIQMEEWKYKNETREFVKVENITNIEKRIEEIKERIRERIISHLQNTFYFPPHRIGLPTGMIIVGNNHSNFCNSCSNGICPMFCRLLI